MAAFLDSWRAVLATLDVRAKGRRSTNVMIVQYEAAQQDVDIGSFRSEMSLVRGQISSRYEVRMTKSWALMQRQSFRKMNRQASGKSDHVTITGSGTFQKRSSNRVTSSQAIVHIYHRWCNVPTWLFVNVQNPLENICFLAVGQ